MTKLNETKKRKRIRLFRKNKKEVGKTTRTASKSIKDATDMSSGVTKNVSDSQKTTDRR